MGEFNLSHLKNFDEALVLCVSGYTRECKHRLLPNDNPYYNIPDLINFIILYYYHHAEKLRSTSDNVKILQNKSIITVLQMQKGDSNIFGSVDIKGNGDYIYSWSFKIIYHKNCICIGIIDAFCENKIPSNKLFVENAVKYVKFYAASGDFIYSHNKRENQCAYGEIWTDNNIVKMELNTKEMTLRYFKNDQNQGIAFNSIDFSNDTIYHLAISCYHEIEALQLIDFTQKHIF